MQEMNRLAEGGDGRGWINVGPSLRDDQMDQISEPTLLGRWFSGRGPAVPMGTWTPPRAATSRAAAPIVGIEHGAGPKALEQLREAGAPLPQGWRKVQDHAKNGIVVEPAPAAPHSEVLGWIIAACWALCPFNTDDNWIAEVHSPRVG